LIDKTNTFVDCKIMFSNNHFSIYIEDSSVDEQLSGKITESEVSNEYQYKFMKNKEFLTYTFYLTADGIVMDL